VSFTTHDNDDVGLSESHLEVPFLVASTLFNVAAVLALIVMRKFPNLGKGQSGH
jgi:antirestriction protein ArdC